MFMNVEQVNVICLCFYYWHCHTAKTLKQNPLKVSPEDFNPVLVES